MVKADWMEQSHKIFKGDAGLLCTNEKFLIASNRKKKNKEL
jgi:hypothetical protein